MVTPSPPARSLLAVVPAQAPFTCSILSLKLLEIQSNRGISTIVCYLACFSPSRLSNTNMTKSLTTQYSDTYVSQPRSPSQNWTNHLPLRNAHPPTIPPQTPVPTTAGVPPAMVSTPTTLPGAQPSNLSFPRSLSLSPDRLRLRIQRSWFLSPPPPRSFLTVVLSLCT